MNAVVSAFRDPASVAASIVAAFVSAGDDGTINARDFGIMVDVRGLLGWRLIGVVRGRGRSSAILQGLERAGLLDPVDTPMREGPRWRISKLGLRYVLEIQVSGKVLSLADARERWEATKPRRARA